MVNVENTTFTPQTLAITGRVNMVNMVNVVLLFEIFLDEKSADSNPGFFNENDNKKSANDVHNVHHVHPPCGHQGLRGEHRKKDVHPTFTPKRTTFTFWTDRQIERSVYDEAH